MSMNVLGICSGRINGNTEIMMKEAFGAIEETCGAICKLVRLQEAKISVCMGCETCEIHHLSGDYEFRCAHPKDSDHCYFIEQLMREADAILIGSPAFNLLPTGSLLTFLNRQHGTGDYRRLIAENNKVGAAFSVGGTDWTNFTSNFCKFAAKELCGSYDAVVDAVHFDFIPAIGAVLLEEPVLERMRELGKNVANALIRKEKGEPLSFAGDPGICPICHGDMLQVRSDGVYCPQCQMKADLSIVNGKLHVDFSEEARAKSRFSDYGLALHDNSISQGHAKAAENRDYIDARRAEYAQKEYAVKLPEISNAH